jgi:hypothetical protein
MLRNDPITTETENSHTRVREKERIEVRWTVIVVEIGVYEMKVTVVFCNGTAGWASGSAVRTRNEDGAQRRTARRADEDGD